MFQLSFGSDLYCINVTMLCQVESDIIRPQVLPSLSPNMAPRYNRMHRTTLCCDAVDKISSRCLAICTETKVLQVMFYIVRRQKLITTAFLCFKKHS